MLKAHSPVVIRFGRLGDTVMLQPLLRKLHLRYGSPCRLLALGNWPQVLYSAQPAVGGFIPLKSQYGPLWLHPQRWSAVLALHRMCESPFYICEPELRTRTKVRPMLALAGVPTSHCVFIEDTPTLSSEHWVDWLLRFGNTTPAAFRTLALAPAITPVAAPQLHVSVAERAERDAWLQAQGLTGVPLVLLQPTNKRTMRWNGVRRAEDDDKAWPMERWIELAHAIRQRLPQAHILFCAAPAEQAYLEQLLGRAATGSAGFSAAALPLGRLKALMEIAHSMVSVDTGPAHLAAAVGCALVVLFGARSPSRWVPRSASGSAVAVVGGQPFVRRVDEIDTAQVMAAWCRVAHCIIAEASASVSDEAAR
ncbi:MAG: glycosyltransferase family 9 protein [Rhodanobacter sp.]